MGEFFAKFIVASVNSELKLGIGMFLKTSAPLLNMNVSKPIKIPTTINKIANKALYSDAFNFSEIFKPICKPIIDPNNKKETSTRSIDLNCIAWAITTNPVIKIVTNKDVDILKNISIPNFNSELTLATINLAKNSPIIYASLSVLFVVFVGFIFSYVRELIHHFRYAKKIKN